MARQIDNNFTFTEKLIIRMHSERHKYGCDIKCLPSGTSCLFRDICLKVLKNHEDKHEESILGKYENGIRQKPKRTKARYFEVSENELQGLIKTLGIRRAPNRPVNQFESGSESAIGMFNANSHVNQSVSVSSESIVKHIISKNRSKTNNSQSKPSDVFNQKTSKWECKDCMTKNEQVQYDN